MKRWLVFLAACSHPAAPRPPPQVTPVELPGGATALDDLQYVPELSRLLVPAGALDLLDPSTGELTQVDGFTGTTSAVYGGDQIYAIDRETLQLAVVDPAHERITAHAALAASPDYVRWVPTTREIWVTEPDAEQIEVFSPDGPAAIATIPVEGGPEALVIAGDVAYTNLWDGQTVVIDVAARAVTTTWANGCAGSRGLALDAANGWLFVGCAEGRVVTLDVAHDGRGVGDVDLGAGVDIIAYDAARRALFVPSGKAGVLTALAVDADGSLATRDEVPVAEGAHCVVTDGETVWVCDPKHGRLLAVKFAR